MYLKCGALFLRNLCHVPQDLPAIGQVSAEMAGKAVQVELEWEHRCEHMGILHDITVYDM